MLIEDAAMQLRPMSDDDAAAELTAVVAAMGAGAPQTEKREFMATAMIVLGQFPAALAREALHEALTEVDSFRKVLPFVKGYCEGYPERFRRRHESLVDLKAYVETVRA